MFSGKDATYSGASVTVEGGGILYVLPRIQENQLRPYVAGYLGWGVLAWQYAGTLTVTDASGIPIKDIDSDGIAFFYFAPEAGLEFAINEQGSFVAGGRILITSYSDSTSEDFGWDLDGGNFVEFFLGFAVTL